MRVLCATNVSARKMANLVSCEWLSTNMKVTYDPEVDALTIILSDAAVEESDEAKPGVILDYDVAGNIVGLEILNASKRVDNPKAIDYALAS